VTILPIPLIGDTGWLVNRTAHAVARQTLNDGEPPLTDLALDGPPDFVDANARTRHRGAGAKR